MSDSTDIHGRVRAGATLLDENSPPVVRRWTPDEAELNRLAAYNARGAEAYAQVITVRWWRTVVGPLRRALGFGPMTPEEAERAMDEAEGVPLSEEQIEAMVRYATGAGPPA
jgi:hypothetical protein